jgi:hypothetical protein
MKQPGFQASDPQPIESNRVRRARGYHRPRRLLLVALLLVLAFAGAVGFIWGVAAMLLTDVRDWGWLALAGLGVFVLARIAVFVLASALSCPLCHGTVMHEKRCRKHEDAFRLGPLSYRASAVLSLLFTGSFRCMYCGTLWRLRRTSRESLH